MKKIILTSLLIAATVNTFQVKSFAADTKVGNSPVKMAQAISIAPELKELTGTIEKSGENEIDVKAKDGKVYTVPIGGFSKLDGFKDLDLKVGKEVSLKAMDFSGTSIGVKAIKIAKSADSKNIKISKEAILAQKISVLEDIKYDIKANLSTATTMINITTKDGDKLFFIPSEITADGKTLKLDKPSITQAISITPELKELIGTIEKVGEDEIDVKAKDSKVYTVPIDQFSKLDGFKDLDLKVGREVSLKTMEFSGDFVSIKAMESTASSDSKDIKGDNIAISFGKISDLKDIQFTPTDAPSVTAVATKDGEQYKLFFIAGEITANGKTLKLANFK